MGTPLCTLAEKYRSDKCPSIHHTYTPFYYELLKGKNVTSMLEIGIGSPSTMPNTPNYVVAAGLRMWADFFPNADVYGIDVNGSCMVTGIPRVHTHEISQTDEKGLQDLSMLAGGFDLIIDDGSHDKDHQVFSAKVLMPFLNNGGIYIIEDLEFPDYVAERLPYQQQRYTGPRVGCGVSDNNLIIMRKG
jgi:hypothetical protein